MTWTARTLLIGLLVGASIASRVAAADPPRPNVVVLLCDDLGYGDLACFGAEKIRTPHLDRLAADGLKLTHCYSAAPVCSPSRAGLLTGRNPYRLGIRDWIPPNSGVHLKREETTIAELLKSAGYRTCHVGKWHLNSRTDGSEPTPGDAGFDHWFYTQNNAAPGHVDPTNFVRNGRPVGPLQGASSHLVVDEALRWLDEVQDAPFFLNVWFHEPHEPVASLDEFLRPYAADDNPDRRQYHANVTQMDAAVGRLLKRLDERGLRDRTLVFFTSDNGPETLRRYRGAERSYGSPGPLRGMKLHVTEAGFRVPGIVRWPGRIQAGATIAEPVSNLDLLPTCCALAGVAPPADRPLDGVDLAPLFAGRPLTRTKPLFWQYDRAISRPWTLALRDGSWKLLADAKLESFQLFDLSRDTPEADDRAAAEPERVRAMAATMRRLKDEVAAEAERGGRE